MRFEVPQVTLNLERFPEPEVNLQAWNAADSYLLEWLAENRITSGGPSCVVNDSFGALALTLAASGEAVVSWSDSFIAHQGAKANAVANGIDANNIEWVPSTAVPEVPGVLPTFGVVAIRVPKSLERLENQLATLAPYIGPETTVVAGGMTKQIHNSTIKCFENVVGPSNTSLARKKARLIFARPQEVAASSADTQPRLFNSSAGLVIFTDPALFSSSRVDPASALLLDALKPLMPSIGAANVVDMGCGTGVIGLSLLHLHPTLAVTFTDESYLAVRTTERSLQSNIDNRVIGGVIEQHRFIVDDCGSTIADGSMDLVVINPPFHDATAQTANIARRMFASAARMLRPDGTVVVVGNRHLKHHTTLRSWFDRPTIIASDRRFVVLQARLK